MRKITILAVCVTALLSTSCASIVSKSSWPIMISSNPSEAKLTITDKKGVDIYTGFTPTTIKLKSGSGFFGKARYQVKIEKEGYQTKVVPVEFKLNGWYFGNILFGGFIGLLIIDPATGAMYRLETETINETLQKNDSVSQVRELKIIDIKDLTEDQKQHLVKL
ncbi:MAG: PEGA domain-containing protein [Bergeyella zoohelcum]|nr:PEGA domain-containing protein [Bergeyella zoohelcum]